MKYVEEHRDVRPQQSNLAYIDQMKEKLQELKDAMSTADQTSKNEDEQISTNEDEQTSTNDAEQTAD